MGFAGDVDTKDLRGPVIDAQQRGEHVDHRRLACPIGAQHAEDLARVDVEVDVVDSGVVAEGLDEPANADPAPRWR